MPAVDERKPSGKDGRNIGIWVEDGLILAAAGALGVYAFRGPLGIDGLPARILLGATLAVMVAIFVRRLMRLIARGKGQDNSDRGKHADQ